MLVIFGLVSDVICGIYVKDGCHMNIFLAICAWFNEHSINISYRKIKIVYLGECSKFLGVWLLVGY